MGNDAIVLQEIMSQPEVWAATRQRLVASRDPLQELLFSQCWDTILYAGSGSSHYLAVAAATLHQQLTGQRSRGVPSSEVALFPKSVYPDVLGAQVLLVAISRSGETSEALWAVDRQRRRGQAVLALTARPGSPLAEQADVAIVAAEADERGVPQTRAFSSLYLAAQYVSGLVADAPDLLDALAQLPAAGRSVLERHAGFLAQIAGGDWARVIFLGSGPYYGLACEGMLKLKEMALAWSEAYHFLEFRHGPISLVDERTLVVGLLSDRALEAERDVLAHVRKLGGRTLAIVERAEAGEGETYSISLDSALRRALTCPLVLLPLQLFAYHRAVSRGLDPDRPRHLEQAVVLAEAVGGP